MAATVVRRDCLAQAKPIPTKAPVVTDINTVPLPTSLNDKPIILTAENLSTYQEFLIAPLASLVEQGLFTARLSRDPGQNFSLPAIWVQASRENEKSFTLSPEGLPTRMPGFEGDATAFSGFPFGNPDAIAAEKDPKVKGKKLLWNLMALPGVDPQLLYGIELSWFNRKGFTKQARGLFYREYLQGKIIPEPAPAPASPSDPSSVIPAASVDANMYLPKFGKALDWRELLQLLQPAVIFGYASVSYRYREPVDDDIWIYSPVLGRSRRVLDSNRTDSILGSELTLDDLFLTSRKPDRVKAEVVAEKTIFVPFSLKEELRLESEHSETGQIESGQHSTDTIPTGRGAYRNRKGFSVGVLWNAESGIFPGLPGWVPTTIQLSPRKVWVVEMQPLDPFAADGTEVLFVDQQTFLPFYKVTYGRKGNFVRWAMATWSPVIGEDERVRFSIPLFIVSIQKGGEQATAIETQYIRRLIGEPALKRKLNFLFDIREHDKRAPKRETPVPSEPAEESPPTETPAPTEDVHD